jgi:GTP-dependent phosphoenolpyruvate carboxykinase
MALEARIANAYKIIHAMGECIDTSVKCEDCPCDRSDSFCRAHDKDILDAPGNYKENKALWIKGWLSLATGIPFDSL